MGLPHDTLAAWVYGLDVFVDELCPKDTRDSQVLGDEESCECTDTTCVNVQMKDEGGAAGSCHLAV